MFVKLFKYEWKTFWKVPAAINLVLLIVTLVGMATLVTPFWDIDSLAIDMLSVTAIMFYVAAIIAGLIAVVVYTAIRFYRNIYTDEGYLTNTLPVTPRMIILSKLLVSSLWSIISGIVVFLSIFMLIFSAAYSFEGVRFFRDLLEFDELWEAWGYLLGITTDARYFGILLRILFSILYTVVRVFFSILMLYTAISLGQLFHRHKIAGAVAWYIAEYVFVQMVSSIFSTVLLYHNWPDSYFFSNFESYYIMVSYGGFLLTTLCCIGMFFLSEFMLKKRLNLD